MDSDTKRIYPRTGKRGVPQQFPRRLYEMLECETKNKVEWEDKEMSEKIIEWSPTGCAFRILNVSLFSNYLLPKYFRTKNFSSFQRNLNLYGFFKARRGPDANMYFHPAFVRGAPYLLSELLKCKKAPAQSPSRFQNREEKFEKNHTPLRLFKESVLECENIEKALKVKSKASLNDARCGCNAAMYNCMPPHQQYLGSLNTQTFLPCWSDESSYSEATDISWRQGNSNEAFHLLDFNFIHASENESCDSLHCCPDLDGASIAVRSKVSLNDCAAMALISLAGRAS